MSYVSNEERRAKRSELVSELEDLQSRVRTSTAHDGHLKRILNVRAGIEKLDVDIEREDKREDKLRDAAHNPRAQEATNEQRESSPDRLVGGDKGARDLALRTVERRSRDLSPEAGDRLELHIRKDRQGLDARYIAAIGSDEYESAFAKRVMDPTGAHHTYTPAESAAMSDVAGITAERALAAGAGPTGAFAVPFTLDPSINNVSDGRINPIRELADVRTITTTTWQGVNSEGVVADWFDEAEESTDDSPTLVQPSITPQMLRVFVPASIELTQDWPSLQAELAGLFADARDELEASSFTNGTAANSPEGLLVGGTATVPGGGTIVDDTYALQQALPPRYQPRAVFLSSNARQNATYRAVANADEEEPALVSEDRSSILGRPWREVSHMVDGPTGLVAAYGDIRAAYKVIDRIGSSIEVISHLFGSNQLPTGQRGFFFYARVGGEVTNANALRVLEVS